MGEVTRMVESTKHPVVKRENWMSPLNRIIWLNAFKARQTNVIVRDGRRFTLDYTQRSGHVWVSIEPPDHHPCGWFDLENMVDELFLTENR
jgi:hypothetical protein